MKYEAVVETALAQPCSKLGLLAQRPQHPGPPLHSVLDAVELPGHRAAFASFLCADWFFGKYAHNYFAKQLLPRTTAHQAALRDAGSDRNTICFACWHRHRRVYLEDEFHCVSVCPEYSSSRQRLLCQLPAGTAINSYADLLQLMSSTDIAVTNAFALFLASVRQTRRKLKADLERINEQVCTKSFASKRVAWRLRGKPTCRHGVLFSALPPNGCKCLMSVTSPADWSQARFMPALNHELKCVVAVPFDLPSFSRLALVQAEMRRLGW